VLLHVFGGLAGLNLGLRVYGHVMRRGEVVQVRVSTEERAAMDRLAAAAGVRLSDWVRSRALEESLDVRPAVREAARVGAGIRVEAGSTASSRASGQPKREPPVEGTPLPKVAKRRWAQ
jgi:hypothetical protein